MKLPKDREPIQVCVDCKTVQDMKYFTCKFCGGLLQVTNQRNLQRTLDDIDRETGIDSSFD